MNSKWHLIVSYVKSLIRLAACVGFIFNQSILALVIFFGVAELLGLLEELGDER